MKLEAVMDQKVFHSKPKKVTVNGIEIVYDTFGEATMPPVLLVMGLGGQMIDWDDGFCSELAAQGYWVIRFDNRDVGLSTKFDSAGIPDVQALIQAQMQGKTIEAPYLLQDMADDSIGLLDVLGIEKAHVVGVSMGGMIAQEMAIRHASRVRTLTSMMSSTGNPAFMTPEPDAMALLLSPPPKSRTEYIEKEIKYFQVVSGEIPFDENRVRERAGKFFDRGLSPAGSARQLAALIASGSRKDALKSVNVPTLVIHGDADPLAPVEGGIETADTIPGAERLIINGMGHSWPRTIWPLLIDAIADHAV
jgi:pimeloyl-ACP methyl ester carboxylesterase